MASEEEIIIILGQIRSLCDSIEGQDLANMRTDKTDSILSKAQASLSALQDAETEATS